jgi:hypothetical protein
MILGLDISTSVIGIALFGEDYKLHEISYIKFKKGTNLFVKLDEFIDHMDKYKNLKISHISIEEPLKKFAGKFSSADTIQKLTQMNAMISGYLYKEFGVEPRYFNVNSARKLVFPNLVIPQSHPSKKSLIWEAVMKAEPTVNWIYSPKTHKLVDENFDMADAYVISMAYIISMIKENQSVA